jgi:hypothetical protein
LWAFLDRNHGARQLRAEIQTAWEALVPGGILAGHDYRDSYWVDVAPTVNDWAAALGLAVHYVPPNAFWVQKPGGAFPEFTIWNQQTLTLVPLNWALNPSICLHPVDSAKRLSVFRSVSGMWDQGRLWIGELDAVDLQFISEPHKLDLEEDHENCEDPRIYVWRGEVWISYTTSTWEHGLESWMHLVQLRQNEAGQWIPVGASARFASPFGQVQEKNWIYFPGPAGELLALYSMAPEWRIHELSLDATDQHTARVVAPGIEWPYGQMRGGSNFFEAANGLWWQFFHSSCHYDAMLDAEPISYYNGVLPKDVCSGLLPCIFTRASVRRSARYFCGLLEVDPQTLLPTRWTKFPLLLQMPPPHGRLGYPVVWPAGAFRIDDEVTLAFGINDEVCHTARFSARLLEELLTR